MAEDELRKAFEERILIFMSGNLHVLLIDSIETDGDTIPIPREKFARDLSKQMEDVTNAYTTNKIIEELEAIPRDDDDGSILWYGRDIDLRIAELRKTL